MKKDPKKDTTKKEIILDLFKIGAIKFGEFKLKSGMLSPIYIDLRIIISYPQLLNKIADSIIKRIETLNYDLITGIPYTALPIATVVSQKINKPMIYSRKEVKDYGTKKQIEGIFQKGQTCLVIDDLITTGASKLETEPFKKNGLKVFDFVVLIDREQGGAEDLKNKGYNLYSIMKISELLDILLSNSKITKFQYDKTKKFIEENKI